jgi:hypothetical protein
MSRTYGRQYLVQWDAEVGRHHVTLGKDSIGFHKTEVGAKALAAAHANQMSLSNAIKTYAIASRN